MGALHDKALAAGGGGPGGGGPGGGGGPQVRMPTTLRCAHSWCQSALRSCSCCALIMQILEAVPCMEQMTASVRGCHMNTSS